MGIWEHRFPEAVGKFVLLCLVLKNFDSVVKYQIGTPTWLSTVAISGFNFQLPAASLLLSWHPFYHLGLNDRVCVVLHLSI